MEANIGEQLRQAREGRGIPLREISDQTRISMHYLEAIESNDYKRLPGGIFNRSFIRAYAKFVGVDEHGALEDYSRTLRERGESDDDGSKMHHSLVYTDDGAANNRSHLKTLILAIIILAALSLAVWAGLHFYQQRQRDGSTNGKHQQFVSALSPRMLSNLIPEIVKEKHHGFIA